MQPHPFTPHPTAPRFCAYMQDGAGCHMREGHPWHEVTIMEWQPIETAPKDRTRMLLYFPVLPSHYDQRCHETVGCWVDSGWWTTGLGAGGLCDGDTQPTHWMPLPAPPKAEEKE